MKSSYLLLIGSTNATHNSPNALNTSTNTRTRGQITEKDYSRLINLNTLITGISNLS